MRKQNDESIMKKVVFIILCASILLQTNAQSTFNIDLDVNGVTFTMVRVSGGNATLGLTKSNSTVYPSRVEHIRGFYIGETEVTQELWTAVMGNNPSSMKCSNCPVNMVRYVDAVEFCKKLSKKTGFTFTLPTESQWEYAARGAYLSRKYNYAGSNNSNLVAWSKENSGGKIHPVKTKKANELGLYDMTGNVAEWCQKESEYSAPMRGGSYEDAIQGNADDRSLVIRSTGHTVNLYDIHKVGFRIVIADVESVILWQALSKNKIVAQQTDKLKQNNQSSQSSIIHDENSKQITKSKSSSQQRIGPRVEIVTKELDLGEVQRSTREECKFVINNLGDEKLIIKRIRIGNIMRPSYSFDSVILPGKRGEIRFTMSFYNAHDGKNREWFTIITNAGNYQACITANVCNHDGQWVVKGDDGYYGVVNKNKKTIIPFVYEKIKHSGNGDFCVKRHGKWGFADKNGRILIPVEYDDDFFFRKTEYYNFEASKAKKNGKYGVVNRYGQEIIPLIYDKITNIGKRYEVKKNGKFGVVDKNGNTIIPCEYDKVVGTLGGIVVKNNKYGIVDSIGNVKIPVAYDTILQLRDVFVIRKKNKWGVMNKAYKMVIPIKYEEIYTVREDKVMAKKNDRWYWVDYDNHIIGKATEDYYELKSKEDDYDWYYDDYYDWLGY